ncbi:hypothetical protein KSF_087170 [Reticulibacter mediterranei]|uniref:Uncharacterized protein n=1 Tax=Reticulibacter mediterranei TaxID=2778369 RepID=A0A8J3IN42_9CHLR|nr:hypothetical protein [Reticulibacter mediterranei]GHO98669.1 hypothetical protein KSF_087170 [Reticulibacter mediterranei]
MPQNRSSDHAPMMTLYQCPNCQQHWVQDGAQIRLRVGSAESDVLARTLQIDLDQVPQAPCRLCLFRAGADTGRFEENAYGRTQGYGLTWEAAEPVGAHLLISVLSEAFLLQSRLPPASHEIRDRSHVRQVLRWFIETEHLPCAHILDARDQRDMAAGLPPGHGMSGTERWQWKGAIFRGDCPPLQGIALITLALALPQEELLHLSSLLHLTKGMLELTLTRQCAQ